MRPMGRRLATPGVKQSVVNKESTFEDYKTCLFDKKEQMRTMNVIRIHEHKSYTEDVNKIDMRSNDDKHIVLENKINTLAYGH